MTDTPTPEIDAVDESTTDESTPETDGSGSSTGAGPGMDSDSVTGSRTESDRAPGTGPEFGTDTETIRRYLAWGALVVCSLLAVYALVQFYGSVGDAIGLWVDPRYQPLIRAAFNLAVLLASLIGVSLVLRELSGDDVFETRP